MTLVIAKHFPDGVAMIGDTCCTLIQAPSMQSPKDWAIKTHIVAPNLCVGFAGNTEFARQGIAKLRQRQKLDCESATKVLASFQSKCFNQESLDWPVDFLVASKSQIFEVKQGRFSERSIIGYVGQSNAFQKIESVVTECPNAKAVCVALRSLYFDNTLRTVGGLAIAVAYRNNRFEFLDDFYQPSGMDVVTVGQDGWYTATAVPGGEYLEEIVVDVARQFVGVYFYLGKCGIGFATSEDGMMNARLSPYGTRMSARDFEHWCKAEFGCQIVAIHARIYENQPDSNLTAQFKVE